MTMNEDDARDLLPWYAADALEPEERAQIEALLAESATLRDELAQLRLMDEAVSDTAGEPQWNPALIHETLARIDAYEAEKAAPSGAGRLATWLRENLFAGWGGVPTLAKAAVAAQFALLLAVGGAWLAQPDTPDGEYGVVGKPKPHVSLMFQADIDQAAVTKLLQELDASVVKGPSSRGLYEIRLEGAETDDPAELERLLDALRARTDVVRFAQPMR